MADHDALFRQGADAVLIRKLQEENFRLQGRLSSVSGEYARDLKRAGDLRRLQKLKAEEREYANSHRHEEELLPTHVAADIAHGVTSPKRVHGRLPPLHSGMATERTSHTQPPMTDSLLQRNMDSLEGKWTEQKVVSERLKALASQGTRNPSKRMLSPSPEPDSRLDLRRNISQGLLVREGVPDRSHESPAGNSADGVSATVDHHSDDSDGLDERDREDYHTPKYVLSLNSTASRSGISQPGVSQADPLDSARGGGSDSDGVLTGTAPGPGVHSDNASDGATSHPRAAPLHTEMLDSLPPIPVRLSTNASPPVRLGSAGLPGDTANNRSGKSVDRNGTPHKSGASGAQSSMGRRPEVVSVDTMTIPSPPLNIVTMGSDSDTGGTSGDDPDPHSLSRNDGARMDDVNRETVTNTHRHDLHTQEGDGILLPDELISPPTQTRHIDQPAFADPSVLPVADQVLLPDELKSPPVATRSDRPVPLAPAVEGSTAPDNDITESTQLDRAVPKTHPHPTSQPVNDSNLTQLPLSASMRHAEQAKPNVRDNNDRRSSQISTNGVIQLPGSPVNSRQMARMLARTPLGAQLEAHAQHDHYEDEHSALHDPDDTQTHTHDRPQAAESAAKGGRRRRRGPSLRSSRNRGDSHDSTGPRRTRDSKENIHPHGNDGAEGNELRSGHPSEEFVDLPPGSPPIAHIIHATQQKKANEADATTGGDKRRPWRKASSDSPFSISNELANRILDSVKTPSRSLRNTPSHQADPSSPLARTRRSADRKNDKNGKRSRFSFSSVVGDAVVQNMLASPTIGNRSEPLSGSSSLYNTEKSRVGRGKSMWASKLYGTLQKTKARMKLYQRALKVTQEELVEAREGHDRAAMLQKMNQDEQEVLRLTELNKAVHNRVQMLEQELDAVAGDGWRNATTLQQQNHTMRRQLDAQKRRAQTATQKARQLEQEQRDFKRRIDKLEALLKRTRLRAEQLRRRKVATAKKKKKPKAGTPGDDNQGTDVQSQHLAVNSPSTARGSVATPRTIQVGEEVKHRSPMPPEEAHAGYMHHTHSSTTRRSGRTLKPHRRAPSTGSQKDRRRPKTTKPRARRLRSARAMLDTEDEKRPWGAGPGWTPAKAKKSRRFSFGARGTPSHATTPIYRISDPQSPSPNSAVSSPMFRRSRNLSGRVPMPAKSADPQTKMLWMAVQKAQRQLREKEAMIATREQELKKSRAIVRRIAGIYTRKRQRSQSFAGKSKHIRSKTVGSGVRMLQDKTGGPSEADLDAMSPMAQLTFLSQSPTVKAAQRLTTTSKTTPKHTAGPSGSPSAKGSDGVAEDSKASSTTLVPDLPTELPDTVGSPNLISSHLLQLQSLVARKLLHNSPTNQDIPTLDVDMPKREETQGAVKREDSMSRLMIPSGASTPSADASVSMRGNITDWMGPELNRTRAHSPSTRNTPVAFVPGDLETKVLGRTKFSSEERAVREEQLERVAGNVELLTVIPPELSLAIANPDYHERRASESLDNVQEYLKPLMHKGYAPVLIPELWATHGSTFVSALLLRFHTIYVTSTLTHLYSLPTEQAVNLVVFGFLQEYPGCMYSQPILLQENGVERKYYFNHFLRDRGLEWWETRVKRDFFGLLRSLVPSIDEFYETACSLFDEEECSYIPSRDILTHHEDTPESFDRNLAALRQANRRKNPPPDPRPANSSTSQSKEEQQALYGQTGRATGTQHSVDPAPVGPDLSKLPPDAYYSAFMRLQEQSFDELALSGGYGQGQAAPSVFDQPELAEVEVPEGKASQFKNAATLEESARQALISKFGGAKVAYQDSSGVQKLGTAHRRRNAATQSVGSVMQDQPNPYHAALLKNGKAQVDNNFKRTLKSSIFALLSNCQELQYYVLAPEFLHRLAHELTSVCIVRHTVPFRPLGSAQSQVKMDWLRNLAPPTPGVVSRSMNGKQDGKTTGHASSTQGISTTNTGSLQSKQSVVEDRHSTREEEPIPSHSDLLGLPEPEGPDGASVAHRRIPSRKIARATRSPGKRPSSVKTRISAFGSTIPARTPTDRGKSPAAGKRRRLSAGVPRTAPIGARRLSGSAKTPAYNDTETPLVGASPIRRRSSPRPDSSSAGIDSSPERRGTPVTRSRSNSATWSKQRASRRGSHRSLRTAGSPGAHSSPVHTRKLSPGRRKTPVRATRRRSHSTLSHSAKRPRSSRAQSHTRSHSMKQRPRGRQASQLPRLFTNDSLLSVPTAATPGSTSTAGTASGALGTAPHADRLMKELRGGAAGSVLIVAPPVIDTSHSLLSTGVSPIHSGPSSPTHSMAGDSLPASPFSPLPDSQSPLPPSPQSTSLYHDNRPRKHTSKHRRARTAALSPQNVSSPLVRARRPRTSSKHRRARAMAPSASRMGQKSPAATRTPSHSRKHTGMSGGSARRNRSMPQKELAAVAHMLADEAKQAAQPGSDSRRRRRVVHATDGESKTQTQGEDGKQKLLEKLQSRISLIPVHGNYAQGMQEAHRRAGLPQGMARVAYKIHLPAFQRAAHKLSVSLLRKSQHGSQLPVLTVYSHNGQKSSKA